MKLKVMRDGHGYLVDNPSKPGSPPVGRGRTMFAAIGDWLVNNQQELGISFDTTDVKSQEAARRRRELAKR